MPPAEVNDQPSTAWHSGIDYHRLTGVENGLRIVYYGIVAMILGVILAIPITLAMTALFVLPLAFIVIGWLMLTFGPFFCLTVPPETRARNLVIASISCNVLAFLVRVVPNVI